MMGKEELLDHLAGLANECGRGSAYAVRDAAGVSDYGDQQQIRTFIIDTLEITA